MSFHSAQEMADLGMMDATLGQRVGFNGYVRGLWEVMGAVKMTPLSSSWVRFQRLRISNESAMAPTHP